MREIRFRAWDKKTKSMFNNAYVDLNYGKLELQMVKDAILLQYTGLKDKNGKEICEGDIVDLGDGAEVKWSQETGAWIVGDWLLCKKIVEIIGNVYENPELLEK